MSTHSTVADDEFIGSAELCRTRKVHPSTVSRWVASGDLKPAHKLPGRNGAFMFRRSDVEKFFADRAEQSA